MTKIVTIEKEVSNANEVVTISEELDKDYSHLTGLAILWTMGKGGIIKSASVGTNDIKKIPKGMEAGFIMTNTYIAPNDRIFDLDEEADGQTFQMEFQDGGLKSSYPFTLKIYLRLENCTNHG